MDYVSILYYYEIKNVRISISLRKLQITKSEKNYRKFDFIQYNVITRIYFNKSVLENR